MYASTELLFTNNRTLPGQRFKRLKTLKDAYMQLFINVLFLMFIIALIVQIPLLSSWNSMSSLYITQAAFWAFSFIFYYSYTSEHWFLRLGGHFSFYKKLRKYVSVLYFIPSFCNIALILIQAVSIKYSEANTLKLGVFHYIVCGVIAFEIFITLPLLIGYIVNVHKFNQIKPIPDVEQYEYLLPCDARTASEIGYRLDGEAVADLLEKQADLIYYLKAMITELNSRLGNRS